MLPSHPILRRTAWATMIVSAVIVTIVVGLVLMLLDGPLLIAPIIGIIAAGLLVVPYLRGGERWLIHQLGAQPANDTQHARLMNVVDGLSLSTGITQPDVLVLDDRATNAMTIDGASGTTLVLTQGLLDELSLLELEAIVAELLVRAREGDAAVSTQAARLLGGLFLSGPLRVASSLAVRQLDHVLDVDRDIVADRQAVGVTRYPPALVSAFAKLSNTSIRAERTSKVNAHLWLITPPDAPVPSHPLGLRIDALEEI